MYVAYTHTPINRCMRHKLMNRCMRHTPINRCMRVGTYVHMYICTYVYMGRCLNAVYQTSATLRTTPLFMDVCASIYGCVFERCVSNICNFAYNITRYYSTTKKILYAIKNIVRCVSNICNFAYNITRYIHV